MKVTRYYHDRYCGMLDADDGGYVLHTDYANLLAKYEAERAAREADAADAARFRWLRTSGWFIGEDGWLLTGNYGEWSCWDAAEEYMDAVISAERERE